MQLQVALARKSSRTDSQPAASSLEYKACSYGEWILCLKISDSTGLNLWDLWMQVVKKCFRDSLGQTCGFTGTCYAADRCPFCDRVSFELCPTLVSPVFLFSCWIFLLNYLNWSTFWFMAHGISRSFKFTELSHVVHLFMAQQCSHVFEVT